MDHSSEANTKFGLSLLHILANRPPDANCFISPFSISTALSMTQLGAGGETSNEMIRTLCWELENDYIIHEQNKHYINLLQQGSDTFVLSSANRIYIDCAFAVLPEFLEKTQKLYLAGAVLANFRNNSENERLDINTWVAEQTSDKIKDLLAPGMVNSVTKMVLVNAIYFKGLWTFPFNPNLTMPKPFKVTKAESKLVPTMYAHGSYICVLDGGKEGLSVLEIPYKGDELSMVILLPNADFGLEDLQQNLSFKMVTSIFSRLQVQREVKIYLPKFEMCCSYQLKEPLSRLGMEKAFNPLEADFSGVTKSSEGLFVSEIVHKAFLKINEKGSEAAAATAVVMAPGCAPIIPQAPIPIFNVDHPFFFVIRDKRASNSVLFMGQVLDPSS